MNKRVIAGIFIIICIISAIYIYNADITISVILFIIIIWISFRGSFNSYIPYGLTHIFYLFTLLFLGLAPLMQYVARLVFWGADSFSEADYIKTNVLIVLALLVYNITYKHVFNRNDLLQINHNAENINSIPISSIKTILISVIATIYIFIAFGHDFKALLLRSEYAQADVVSTGGLGYLFNSFFIRPIPAICFLLYKLGKQQNKYCELFLLCLMLLTNAPTGMPRFAVAAFYIPLVFIYIKWFRRPLHLPLFMIFAIMAIFPFLDIFRGKESIDFGLLAMLSANFDSYQMMMQVVANNYITWGYQLLGCLFFFVPRSIWPSKPIGSGYLTAHENNYFFDNLSMNYLGEGYINFGLFGVILFAFIIARINASFDKRYWCSQYELLPSVKLIYFISMGMEFAIYRGALLNIMPVLVGYIVMTKLVYYCVKIKRSRDNLKCHQ